MNSIILANVLRASACSGFFTVLVGCTETSKVKALEAALRQLLLYWQATAVRYGLRANI
jgi:hypothetical protein